MRRGMKRLGELGTALLLTMILLLSVTGTVNGEEATESSKVGISKTKTTVLKVGDPISAATGEYFFIIDPFNLGGPLPVTFSLLYGSQMDVKRFSDGLPAVFTGTHTGGVTRYVDSTPEEVYADTGAGREYGFHKSGSGWEPFSLEGVRCSLKETDGFFYLLQPEEALVYTYKKEAIPWSMATVERISETSEGAEADNWSADACVSEGGGIVAFGSEASNLVPPDTNGKMDVFVRDRASGQVSLISVTPAGASGSNISRNPAITPDGRHVAFESYASDLVEDDLNGYEDIFVRDREQGETCLVSVSSGGTQGNGHSSYAAISADGRYVAFASSASNLVSDDTNEMKDIFVHDRINRTTTRVSIHSDGTQGNGHSFHTAISADGRYVAFTSEASTLVSDDTNGTTRDVFVHDRETGETRRVSVASDLTEGDGGSEWPSLSADGRYVTFYSSATNLVAGDTNGYSDVFLHDIQEATTVLVSAGMEGAASDNSSHYPSISADGRFVAFESWASNLAESDTNWSYDVFVRDMVKGTTTRASVSTAGVEADDGCFRPSISADGGFVVFYTDATSLVDNVVNESQDDVYLAAVTEASQARLVQIEDRNGNSLVYTYDEGDFTHLPASVEDGLGRRLSFTYDQVGVQDTMDYLMSVTDDQGRTCGFAYEEKPGDNPQGMVLRSITDPMGAVTTFAYAGYGAIAGVTYPEGNTPYTQTYQEGNVHGVVATQQDADGNVTQLTLQDLEGGQFTPYASGGSSLIETRPDGASCTYEHDHQGRVVKSLTDPAGHTAQFSSDPVRDELTGVTDRLGGVTTVASDPDSGLPTSVTNAFGNTISYTYAAQEQAFSHPEDDASVTFTFHALTKEEYPDGTSISMTTDSKGNIAAMTGPSGETWTFAYDSQGRLTSRTNPVRGITSYTYNDDGTAASVTDPDGVTATFSHDALRRLTGITLAGISATAITYDANGRVTRLTDPGGRAYQFSYDTNGNLTAITDPQGNVASYSYDAMDRPVRMIDRTGAARTIGYDALGRISEMTDPSGAVRSFQYDSLDRVVGMTRGGVTWQTGYDAEGVVNSRTTPLGCTTEYVTDVLGQVTQKTDALGRSVSFVRDDLNRLTAATDGLGRTREFAYTSSGLLSSLTLPETGSLILQYDARGMLAGITDRRGNTWPFSRSESGRMTSATTPAGYVKSYEYDSQGRVASVNGSDGQSVSFTRDATGNITQKDHSDGTTFTYTYDALNRLTATEGLSLTRSAEGLVKSTSTGEKIFGAVYDAAGRLVSASYDGGLTVTYSYDEDTGLLSNVSDNLTGAVINFTYDQDRHLTGVTRSNGINGSYSYDNAGRLVRIQEGSIIDLSYTLDNASQVTAVDMTVPLDPAEVPGFRTRYYAYDSACRPGSTGYAVDDAGRTTASPTHRFAWHAEGLLTGMDDTDLSYNGMADLLSRSEGGITTRYHYNYGIGLHPIVAEEDGSSGVVTHCYVWSPQGELLYGIDMTGSEPAVSFYHFDLTGSTLALTDGNGHETDAYAYTPYGRVLGHQGASLQPFTYAGKWGVRQESPDGTLFHVRVRYYDAQNGRFLSPEPLWPEEPDLHMLNPYLYAHANPVSMVDVTGYAPMYLVTSEGTPMKLNLEKGSFEQLTAEELKEAYLRYTVAQLTIKDCNRWIKVFHKDIISQLQRNKFERFKEKLRGLGKLQKALCAARKDLEEVSFMGKRKMQQKGARLWAEEKAKGRGINIWDPLAITYD